MAEEYWAGFRPQPQKVAGELTTVELSTETLLTVPQVFARASTRAGFESWGVEVRKLDARPGGRIDITLWQELNAEGAFAAIDLGRKIEFTLDAVGLVCLSFASTASGSRVDIRCSRIVEPADLPAFKELVARFLNSIATN